MYHKYIVPVLLAFIMTLSGCAVVDYAKENPFAAETAVKVGTLRFIDEASSVSDQIQRAKEVVFVVELVLSEMGTSQSATVSTLTQTVRARIDWNKFDPYERLLLDSLIFSVQQKLLDRVGDGVISEEDEIVVYQSLEWVIQAAKVYTEGRDV